MWGSRKISCDGLVNKKTKLKFMIIRSPTPIRSSFIALWISREAFDAENVLYVGY